MDRREVEIFISVMRLGSVTAAAKALSMAQPSVSKAIALMEKRLGFRLFERTLGRLKPTAEAALVMNEATRIEQELSRFDRYLSGIQKYRHGQLRVAATPALALNLLPLAAKAFRERMPEFGLVLDMQLNHEIPRLTERGQYDLGLVVIPSSDVSAKLRAVRGGRIVCVMPRKHHLAAKAVVSWSDMAPDELIYITTDVRMVGLLSSVIPDFERTHTSALETNRYTTAVNLVRQGLGMTLVDEFTMIGLDTAELAVRPFSPPLNIMLAAAIGEREIPHRAIEHFLQYLESAAVSAVQTVG